MQLSSNHILLYLRIAEACDHIALAFQQSGFQIVEFRDLPALTSWHQRAPMRQRVQAAALATVQHGGLSLAEMALLPVVLIDLQPDIKSAMQAVRLHAADYILYKSPAAELATRAAALHTLLSARAIQGSASSKTKGDSDTGPAATAVTFDPHLHAIRKGDMWVPLSPIEWRLFQLLLQKRGRIVSSIELTTTGLHREQYTHMETSLLRLHMSRLRAKLQRHFDNQFTIITLRGQGYMLE
jgi:DNA-binding response OmpR family regulator